MSSKFFNNNGGNTLFAKLKGIAQSMANFDRFLAVVGFFRSSGYFKLRKELGSVSEIKILVGINVDELFRRHNQALLMLADETKAKKVYSEQFKEDILNARYSKDVEEGIFQMSEDLACGRLQMRIHDTKNLHAKFYLCLPQDHNENSDGWVIMGSSNISESGLGVSEAPRYELNVAMKDYDDVAFCKSEFDSLWEEAIPLSIDDIELNKKKTYLGYQPTPYEIYIKVLIETFGDQVEDDFTIQLPDGVLDLKYQKDAVIQGYQMLLKHNGLFLADVVGLGKTMIATMIAKRYIEANGKNTSILVIYPPALEDNWKQTFKLFGIERKAQFITNGSLHKVLNGENQYKEKEEFDLIIVDEAHGFRSDQSGKYDELQKICKSACANVGLLRSLQKKVMLLSATPLNNRPQDLLNQLLLFQNSQSCTIDGIPNLKAFFAPYIAEYGKLMRERDLRDITSEVDRIYDAIREKVIDKVTVRRTRHNILNDPDYRKDLERQHIVFPSILAPNILEYSMDEDTSERFFNTLSFLTDPANPMHLEYARYRAIEFLKPEFRSKYQNAEHLGQSLAGIYKVHMVKRLESSFHAFKKSLQTLLRITNDMIRMFDEGRVIIAPDLKVKDLQAKGMELDEIIEYAVAKGYLADEITFSPDDFDPKLLKLLKDDKDVLEYLIDDWKQENDDPKYDLFMDVLDKELMLPEINKEGKLVIFSESVDTLNYLYGRMVRELGREDITLVTSHNRNKVVKTVKENFDANSPVKLNAVNIILTSDVLAEGVNLHRSNVIVNYDSPWNATRLMQRIGRVNRIGSVAENIYNYMFYPSKQGNSQIQLYENALMKLQGFHSAFGEDAQIYSREEIVKQFEMFDSNVRDAVDKKIQLLREVRELYTKDRKLYNKIKNLPMKSRVMRDTGKHSGNSIVFVSSNVKTEFYLVNSKTVEPLDFLEAVKYLKAKLEELPAPFGDDNTHFEHVNRALDSYSYAVMEARDDNTARRVDLDQTSLRANNFLRTVKRITQDPDLIAKCDILINYINDGVYAQLPRFLKALAGEFHNDRSLMKEREYYISTKIDGLIQTYHSQTRKERNSQQEVEDPRIIISETFK